MNSVIISGRIGRIFKKPDNESKNLRFGFYTVHKGKNGFVYENYTISVFGEYAEKIAPKLVEKLDCLIMGHLSANSYKDKSGKNQTVVSITAESIFFDVEGETIQKQIRKRQMEQENSANSYNESNSDRAYDGNPAEDESAPF